MACHLQCPCCALGSASLPCLAALIAAILAFLYAWLPFWGCYVSSSSFCPFSREFLLCSFTSSSQSQCWPLLVCLEEFGWLGELGSCQLTSAWAQHEKVSPWPTSLSSQGFSTKREVCVETFGTIHSRNANEFPWHYSRPWGHLGSSSFLVFGENSSRMSNALTLVVQLAQLVQLETDSTTDLQVVVPHSLMFSSVSSSTCKHFDPMVLVVACPWTNARESLAHSLLPQQGKGMKR